MFALQVAHGLAGGTGTSAASGYASSQGTQENDPLRVQGEGFEATFDGIEANVGQNPISVTTENLDVEAGLLSASLPGTATTEILVGASELAIRVNRQVTIRGPFGIPLIRFSSLRFSLSTGRLIGSDAVPALLPFRFLNRPTNFLLRHAIGSRAQPVVGNLVRLSRPLVF